MISAPPLLRWIAAGFTVGVLLASLPFDYSGASPRSPYRTAPTDAGHAGSISGFVRFAEGQPEHDVFPVTRDREICGPDTRTVDWVRMSGSRLLDVVVFLEYVEVGKPFAPQSEKAALVQKGCRFAPSIQVVQDGGDLVLSNQDPILHNAQAYEIIQSARRKFVNVVQEAGAEPFVTPVRTARGNVIKFECSAHEFMHSWLFVAHNPYYAQADESGTFRIGDVPEGQYRIRAWHPRLGFRETTANVVAGQDAEVVFDF